MSYNNQGGSNPPAQSCLAGGESSKEEKLLRKKQTELQRKYRLISIFLVGIIIIAIVAFILSYDKCRIKGHVWDPATCTHPQRCTVCAATEGSPLGHSWQNATFNDPKRCIKCGETEGAKKTPGMKFHLSDIAVEASASSIMSGSDEYRHDPGNLYDHDKRTNWTEGVAGDGLGEFVVLRFDRIYAIKEISLYIGSHYEKDSTYFEKNNRPSAITLTFSDGSSEYILLEDTRAYQTFTFSEYYYTDYVKITIEAVYKGTQWDETIIAEVDFAMYLP